MNGETNYLRDIAEGLMLWPESAATAAPKIDYIFYGLTAATVIILVALTLLILYYSIRYRAGANVDRTYRMSSHRRNWIEIGWTVPTLLIFLGFFAWAATAYLDIYRSPPDALPVNVIAKQWMWKVQHENGAREINELHIPVNQKIRLRMTSQDVIHSFYIPAFRIKRDVLPSRYTSLWFEANKPGTYSLFCAEFCGVNHSRMRGRIIVMQPGDYERWLSRQNVPQAPAIHGKKLFASYGCSGCHSEGSKVHAPSLVGIYGRPVQLADGGTVMADDDYIRDSILLPRKQMVAGYEPIMPSFQNQVSESDILALVAYIKSLSEQEDEGASR